MDLESLRIFVKVAELASFTRAAEHLGIPKSRVSLHVQTLETEVGAQLLQRTTRIVRLTAEGEQFIGRARRLALEAEELEAMFQAPSNLRGTVRVDLPVGFARDVLIPRLPDLLAAHPQIDVVLSTTDRRVEVVREGFDCVLSVGNLKDSGLVARRLGILPMMNYASPAYVKKYGAPRVLEDLDHHFIVHYALNFGSSAPSFEYPAGEKYEERPMRCRVTVNSTDAYRAACVAGLGIIQAPRSANAVHVREGTLVEVLPRLTCEPMPVSLVHPHGRNVPKRVRAVMAWIAQSLEGYVE